MERQLDEIRSWAKDKLKTGQEPPWAWYQYMKLVETIDAILAGQDVAQPTKENSPQSVERRGAHLRLVGSTYQPDSAQHRPEDDQPQMPM